MQTLYLSRLQHYLFCPRQFALIELECAWEENIYTAEGQVMHERVNSGENETRGNIKTVRTLRLGHETLGLEGVADVVEYHTDDDNNVTPYPSNINGVNPKPIEPMRYNYALKPYAWRICTSAMFLKEHCFMV